MLSGAALRKLSLLLSPLLLVGALVAVVVYNRPGSAAGPAAETEKEHGLVLDQKFLGVKPKAKKASKWSEGVTMDDIGIFSGLRIEQDFKGAARWERHCAIHPIPHGDSEDQEVYTAAYNECTGVSDVVYYKVSEPRFEVGAGRYSGWKNDDALVDLMDELDKTPHEYATVVDYQGVGLFGIDRGHQAPVGSFNADEESARMTNTPTNLSPQNGYLNEKGWMYLEKEMRFRATEAADESESEEEDEANEFELLTGPLYELPEAFFENTQGQESWKDLLWRGGEVNMKGMPWCKRKHEDGFRSVIPGKEDKITCDTGRYEMSKPSDDPNKLSLHYSHGPEKFPLRIPLGYYKLAVITDDSTHGRQTCPYIFDQTGQCLLVSVDVLAELAHIDLEDSDFFEEGGDDIQKEGSNHKFSAKVDPDFCIRKGGTLDKKKLCYTASHDATEITVEMLEDYWDQRNEVE